MGLKKGHTNNPTGRPKGAVNKASAAIRERITAFLDANFDQVQKDFQSPQLSVKDKLKFYTDLLPYAVPKLQATTLDINFDALTDEQLETIIQNLIKASADEHDK